MHVGHTPAWKMLQFKHTHAGSSVSGLMQGIVLNTDRLKYLEEIFKLV